VKQVNQTYGGSYNFNKLSDRQSKVLTISLNLQNAESQGQVLFSNSTLAAIANYAIVSTANKSTVSVGVNYFDITYPGVTMRQTGLNVGYSVRSEKNQFSVRGGSMISLGDRNYNNHCSLRYRRNLTPKLGWILSTTGRYNQLVNKENRLILRTDMKIIVSF